MKCGFSIKKPNQTRRTFSVHKKIRLPDRTTQQPLVKDERLDAINASFKSGILNEDEALTQIKAVLDKIRAEESKGQALVTQAVISEKNLAAYKAFMKEHYTGKDLVRPQTVRNEFNFALLGIEPLSVVSSTRLELQKKCDSAFDPSQHRRYVGRINQLLKYCGRDFVLHTKKKRFSPIRYTDFPGLLTTLNRVQNPQLKLLYITLYATGVRLGEAFTIYSRDIKPNDSIYIQSQMDEKLEVREIKNRKPHHTVILPEGKAAVKAWAAISKAEKESLRTRCQHPLIIASDYTLSPHDLRHSFAIHLLGLGVALDKVAKLIGDSIKTTEEYYAGFTMSSSEVDIVRAVLKASKPK